MKLAIINNEINVTIEETSLKNDNLSLLVKHLKEQYSDTTIDSMVSDKIDGHLPADWEEHCSNEEEAYDTYCDREAEDEVCEEIKISLLDNMTINSNEEASYDKKLEYLSNAIGIEVKSAIKSAFSRLR